MSHAGKWVIVGFTNKEYKIVYNKLRQTAKEILKSRHKREFKKIMKNLLKKEIKKWKLN